MTQLKNKTIELKDKAIKDYVKRLESERIQMATVNNSLIMNIVSTVPFKGEIGGSNISVMDQLHKLIKAYNILPKLRKLAIAGSEQEDCYSCKEILFEINGVLGDDI